MDDSRLPREQTHPATRDRAGAHHRRHGLEQDIPAQHQALRHAEHDDLPPPALQQPRTVLRPGNHVGVPVGQLHRQGAHEIRASFFLAQDAGEGLFYTGTRDWVDYSASVSGWMVNIGEGHEVVVRVQA
ncbi:hypothetical protein PMIN06_004042 [Paraphaeosphaeria minitans]